MKRLILISLFLALLLALQPVAAQLAIDATNFPDPNFRNFLLAQEFGKDASIAPSELETIKSLDLYGQKIDSLNGIEYFTHLERLNCGKNYIASLAVDKLVSLRELQIAVNRIDHQQMALLVASLPTIESTQEKGKFIAIDSEDYSEENLLRSEIATQAIAKGWLVYDAKGGSSADAVAYTGYSDREEHFEGTPWTGIATSWTKGSGTQVDPFLIEQPEHLAYLAQQVNEGKTFEGIYFMQTQSLNMGAKELGREKANFRPIGIFDAGYVTAPGKTEPDFVDDSLPFEGNYNGRNFAITNLYQYYHNETEKTVGGGGLFGYVGAKGVVRNLYLTRDCCFEGNFEGGSFAGYLEGKLLNAGSKAVVRGTSIVGGLVGVLYGGTIANCFFQGLVSGTMNVGGLSGYLGTPNNKPLSTPTIMNCYVNGNVQSKYSFVGSAIGFVTIQPKLANIYTTGAVSGKALNFMKGAFIGALDGELVPFLNKLDITNCFYDSQRININKASSDGDIVGIEPKTTQELQSSEILARLGDSFQEDTKNENRGYPTLKRTDLTSNEEIAIPSTHTKNTIAVAVVEGKIIVNGTIPRGLISLLATNGEVVATTHSDQLGNAIINCSDLAGTYLLIQKGKLLKKVIL